MKNIKNVFGKARIGLLPSEPLFEVAKAMDFGAKKYKAWNWVHAQCEDGELAPEYVYAEAAQRHFARFTDRTVSDIDDESGICHLAMGLASGMIGLWHWLRAQKLKTEAN